MTIIEQPQPDVSPQDFVPEDVPAPAPARHVTSDYGVNRKPEPSAPDVDLDLDVLERENGAIKPFVFNLGGHQFLLSDPKEVDWQDLLAAMQNPILFFRFTLTPDQHRRFFGSKLPSWKMDALIKRYTEHYGLPGVGEPTGLRV